MFGVERDAVIKLEVVFRLVGQQEPVVGLIHVVPHHVIQVEALDRVDGVVVRLRLIRRVHDTPAVEQFVGSGEDGFGLEHQPLAAAVAEVAEVDQALLQTRLREIRVGVGCGFVAIGYAVFAHMVCGTQDSAVRPGIGSGEGPVEMVGEDGFFRRQSHTP